MDLENLSDEDLTEVLTQVEELDEEVNRLYVPHPKQKLFHCAPNKIRAVFGGNRSGKTEVGTNEARFHTTGNYPEWYPADLRFHGPTRGRIVVTDFKKGAGEVLEPKLKRWFGKEIIKIERSMGNISKVYVQHISGGVSAFDVMSYEQDINQFQGWSGHWAWFDEPPPRDIYIACLRGMVDFNGRMWITATPLNEPWMFDEIVANVKRDAWHTMMSIHDNPHITKQAVDDFLVSLRPEEREAMEWGKFLHLTGRVYGELDSNVHVIDKLPEGHNLWPVWFVLDPADRRPHHGIWAKVDPFSNIYIFDELVYKGTIKDTAKEILKREITGEFYNANSIRILDPNKGRSPSSYNGLMLVDEFASHAVYFTTDVNDDISLGHLAVKEKLSYDVKQPISTTNHPKLYFLRDKTKECVRQLYSYVWDDWRGRSNSSRSEKEKPKDISKDMPDCLRYLVMSNPKWYYPYDETRPRTGFSVTGYGD